MAKSRQQLLSEALVQPRRLTVSGHWSWPGDPAFQGQPNLPRVPPTKSQTFLGGFTAAKAKTMFRDSWLSRVGEPGGKQDKGRPPCSSGNRANDTRKAR